MRGDRRSREGREPTGNASETGRWPTARRTRSQDTSTRRPVAGHRRLHRARPRLRDAADRHLRRAGGACRLGARPAGAGGEARTGRDLVVAGPSSLMLFPRLGGILRQRLALSASGHGRRADAEGGDARSAAVPALPPVAAGRRQARYSLLGRSSSSTSTRKAGGAGISRRRARASCGWRRPASGMTGRACGAPRRTRSSRAALEKIVPVRVTIANGTVRYRDERTRLGYEVTGLDLDLALDRIDGPLELKGNLAWLGEKLVFDGTLSTPRSALVEQKARLAASCRAGPWRRPTTGTLGSRRQGSLERHGEPQGAIGAGAGNLDRQADDGRAGPGRAQPVGFAQRRRRPDLAVAPDGNGRRCVDRGLAGDRHQGRASPPQPAICALGARFRPSADAPGPASAPPRAPAPAPARRVRARRSRTRGTEAPPVAAQVRGLTSREGGGSDWSDDAIDSLCSAWPMRSWPCPPTASSTRTSRSARAGSRVKLENRSPRSTLRTCSSTTAAAAAC